MPRRTGAAMSEGASGSPLPLEAIVAESAGLLAAFLADSATTCCLVVSTEGIVLYCNGALGGLLEQPAAGVIGQPVERVLGEAGAAHVVAQSAARLGAASRAALLTCRRRSGTTFSLRCHIDVRGNEVVIVGEPVGAADTDMQHLLFDLNNQLAVTAREHARQKRELEQSHWRLKKIGELLPMCVQCGRVESGAAVWEDVKTFFQHHSEFLSHGCCPDCAARLSASWGLE